MIKINFTKRANHYIKVRANGHANSDEYGEDLICAAVSSIMFGTCNALNMITKINDIEILDNEIIIDVKKPTHDTDVILETLKIQLETIREGNKKNIRIKEMEE